MRLLPLKRYKFVFDFLQSRTLCAFYNKIKNTSTEEYFYKDVNNVESDFTNDIHIVRYIPPFIKPILDKSMGLNSISIFHFNGFMINLDAYKNVNDYLKAQMSSKSRTKIRSYLRKLEKCFNIKYTCYFGEITKEEYDCLISKLHLFLIRRFQQRGDTHELLGQWESIRKNTYDLIVNKMASLFVIYADEEPIDICLNYHYVNIFHNGIRSYDIDYSKFRLGYIDILKQLEWCFAHNMQIFDLSAGDMSYKRIWCNVVYEFEHQILYDKKSISKSIIAIALAFYLKAKVFFKKKYILKSFKKIWKLGQKTKNIKTTTFDEPKFEQIYLDVSPESNKMSPIDLTQESYSFLRKPLHDYQYANLEPSKDIIVYKSITRVNRYYITGKKKIVQLTEV